jgi:hypothetical protein
VQRAKAAGTLNGASWSDFRKSQCDAGTGSGTAKTSAAPAGTIVVAANAVFPSAVDAKYSSEKSGRARRKTCLDQYKANKSTNANGGLKWLQRAAAITASASRSSRARRDVNTFVYQKERGSPRSFFNWS